MIRKICLAAALLMPSVSHAQDWRIAAAGNQDKTFVLVDMASIVTQTEFPRANVLTVLSEDHNGTAAVAVVMEFDCATDRRHGRSAVMYDINGNIRGRAGVEPEWNVILRHTIYMRTKEFVCGGGVGSESRSIHGALPSLSTIRDVLRKNGSERQRAERLAKEAEGKDPLWIEF